MLLIMYRVSLCLMMDLLNNFETGEYQFLHSYFSHLYSIHILLLFMHVDHIVNQPLHDDGENKYII